MIRKKKKRKRGKKGKERKNSKNRSGSKKVVADRAERERERERKSWRKRGGAAQEKQGPPGRRET